MAPVHPEPPKNPSAVPGKYGRSPARYELVAKLEGKVRYTIDRFNDRDWDSLRAAAGIAPGFVANLGGESEPLDFDELVKTQQKYIQRAPGYHINIMNISVDIDLAANYATCYILTEIAGRPDNIIGENTLVMEFYSDGYQWLWCRHSSMRGIIVGPEDPSRIHLD